MLACQLRHYWCLCNLASNPGAWTCISAKQADILTHCLVLRDFVGGIEKLGLFVEWPETG